MEVSDHYNGGTNLVAAHSKPLKCSYVTDYSDFVNSSLPKPLHIMPSHDGYSYSSVIGTLFIQRKRIYIFKLLLINNHDCAIFEEFSRIFKSIL